MTPLLNNWTIVLVGRWNIEILNPEWVGENLFGSDDIDVDIALDGMTTKIRYKINNIIFLPKSDRITFSVTDTSDKSLCAMETAARSIMEKLPITPISAVGINFTFLERNFTPRLLELFDFKDINAISDAGIHLNKSSVRREFVFEDRVLNFLATYSEAGARVGFNYHSEARESHVAIEKISGRLIRLRDNSVNFLEKIYGLTMEEAEL